MTDRCNLRCTYCMPEPEYAWLPRQELLDFDELSLLVDAFAAAGVDRVRITGGEPLLRRDLPVLVTQLATKAHLREVALTTNGLLLSDQAKALATAGLGRLTVSLDTLRPERFLALTRRDALAATLAGIDAAIDAGLGHREGGHREGGNGLKIDAVVLRGVNDDELCDLIAFGRTRGAEVRFIEYMDVGGATAWSPSAVVTAAEIRARIATELGTPEPIPERGSAPAQRYVLPDGTVFGIIASVSEPFCRDCDRSRITADGLWLHCLYATRGVDLKTPLRAGAGREGLADMIARGWEGRSDRGAELRAGMPARGAFVPVDMLRRDPHLEMHKRGG